MQRRSFIIALYGLVAAGPLARRVRAADAPVRIGFQGNATTPAGQALVDCFRAGLRNAGWIEGQNVTIDYEYTEGVEARNSVVALDIVRAKPDVIVTTGTPGTQAMQRAAGKIPDCVHERKRPGGERNSREPGAAWRETSPEYRISFPR